MQLGRKYERRRLVFTAGNFSVLDFFDKNSYSGDLRQQFFNMAFLTYAAYDFAADARGYAWGAMAELYWDDWAFRIGRMTPPHDPNQLPIDFRLYEYYGDQAEIEHQHRLFGRPGAARVLGYRNRENMPPIVGACSSCRRRREGAFRTSLRPTRRRRPAWPRRSAGRARGSSPSSGARRRTCGGCRRGRGA
jgi:high affinity Mn2+ porin